MKSISLILLLGMCIYARGQNLLQNGSFENPAGSHPTNKSQLDNCDIWESDILTGSHLSYTDCHSPDWVTSDASANHYWRCFWESTPGINPLTRLDAPDGDKYAFIGAGELIQQKLTSSNEPETGATYVLSFKMRLPDSKYNMSVFGGSVINGVDQVVQLKLKAWIKKTKMKYDERNFNDAISLYVNNDDAYFDYQSTSNAQEIMDISLSDYDLDTWNLVQVEFTADDNNYDWFVLDAIPPHGTQVDWGVLIDDIKIEKGCIEKCLSEQLFENRKLSQGNPLPGLVIASDLIKVGKSVDPSQTDGTVELTSTESAELISGKDISLEDGFAITGEFVARIDPNACDNPDKLCVPCCEEWDGFPTNLEIDNYLTLGGSGSGATWEVRDYSNPSCAFGATGYILDIFNRWDNAPCSQGDGMILHREVLAEPGKCCPFISPSSSGDPTQSSIKWDGKTRSDFTGNWVDVATGTYYYCLKLIGCDGKTMQSYSGSISVIHVEPNQDDLSTSINDESAEDGLEVYPNPVSELLHFSSDKSITSYTLSDMNGKEVLRADNLNTMQISQKVSHLLPGIYNLSVRAATATYHRQITIK